MAPRPAWKGYLKLSLVTCAVELTNATTQSEKISFRTINRETSNTVKRQYVDSVTGEPVEEENEVKGYEVGDNEFLLVEEEEIEAVQIEASHTLSLDRFVEKSSIDQVYLDAPYYLTPADEVSEEAFAVIREAMDKRKMAGLASIVLYRRERPCVIEPLGKGMLLTTLRYDKTVRRADEIFSDVSEIDVKEDMVDLATTIIEKKASKFDPDKFEDRYEDALLELIEAKKKGKKVVAKKEEAQPSNVVNLFDALKKSLAGEKKGSVAPDKASAEKPEPKPAAKKKPASSASRKKQTA